MSLVRIVKSELPRVLLLVSMQFGVAVHAQSQSNSTSQPGASRTFTESFNGGGSPAAPAAPAAWNPRDWDVQVHVRSQHETPGVTTAHPADHGPLCEAPGADGRVTHSVSGVNDTVYQCANHVMTSLHADDYGLISLTPPVVADFSAGEVTISFDLSTLSNSNRDWPGVVIQPMNESLALPLSDVWPDLNGYGRRAIELDFVDGVICPVVIREFERAEGTNKFADGCQWWKTIDELAEPSAQTRQRVEIVVSRTRIRVSVPALNLVWADMTIADLGWDQGLVSLMHHSYTPFKDGNGGPNTWHWDSLEISPSRPIFINQAEPRWVNSDGGVFRFSEPAPENSFLRGSALGTKLEVSFDGGASWEVASYQASLAPEGSQPTWQFWHPVPPGIREVMVRSGAPSVEWWSAGWIAKDLSLFSDQATVTDPVSPAPVPLPAPVPAEPPTAQCRTVETVQQLVNGQWVELNRRETAFQAAACL